MVTLIYNLHDPLTAHICFRGGIMFPDPDGWWYEKETYEFESILSSGEHS